MRVFTGSTLATLGVAMALSLGLAGCAAGGMGEELPPSLGGLPADAPAPPKKAYKYPAVHDMPPPRASRTMTDDEQIRLEKELQTTRDRIEGKSPPAKKPVAARKTRPPAAKNQPLDIKSGQASGAVPKP